MRSIRFTLIFAVILVFSLAAFAMEWTPVASSDRSLKSPAVKTIKSTDAELILEMNIFGIFEEEVDTDEGKFHKLYLNDLKTATGQDTGAPSYPYHSEMISIPRHKKAELLKVEFQWKKIDNKRLYPLQVPRRDNDEKLEFAFNPQAYKTDEPVPAENVWLSPIQGWSGIQVAGLHFCPVRYIPGSGSIEIAVTIRVEIGFTPGGRDDIISSSYPNQKIIDLQEKLLLNPPPEPPRAFDADEPEPVRLLAVVEEDALETVQPLIDFHHKRGLRTEVWLADAIEDEFEIRDRIEEMYVDGLWYVLLIGDGHEDHFHVPMHDWDTDYPGGCPDNGPTNTYSDSWFTCLDPPDEDGWDDHIPELAIGRLIYTGDNFDQLEIQVSKLMNYYTWENVQEDGEWLGNSLFLGSRPGRDDEDDAFVNPKQTIQEREYNLPAPNFTLLDGRDEEVDNNTVIQFINDNGVGTLNYRGHGSSGRWALWNQARQSFDDDDIERLENAGNPFIVLSCACQTGNIATYNWDCLIESFQKHDNGGSMSAYGAVISSWRDGNDHWDITMFSAWFNEGVYDVGSASNFASISTVNAFMGNRWPIIGLLNFRTYLWLGDPTLELRIEAPAEAEVEIVEFLPLGSEEITARVTIGNEALENAWLCIRNEEIEDFYYLGVSAENGDIVIPLDDPIAEPMLIDWMVYHRNTIPAEGEILALDGFGAVQGTVTELANGAPIENAAIEVTGFNLAAQSGVNGAYRIENVPVGEHRLIANAEGFHTQRADIEVIADEAVELDFEMRFSELALDTGLVHQRMEIGQDAVYRAVDISNSGDAPLEWSGRLDFNSGGELYEIVHEFDPVAALPNGDARLNGMVVIEDTLYMAGGNRNADPNYLYKFSLAGEYLGQIEQPNGGFNGLFAIDYYDGHIYGSPDQRIFIMNREGEIERMVLGQFNPNRALTVDDEGLIWTGDGNNPIYQIQDNGQVRLGLPVNMNIHALAWAPWMEDDYKLLALILAEEGVPVQLAAINAVDGETRRLAGLSVQEDETPGCALTVTDRFIPGRRVLIGLIKRGAERTVKYWDLGAIDTWLSVSPLEGVIDPGDTTALEFAFNAEGFEDGMELTSELIIANNGNDPEVHIDVVLEIVDLDVANPNRRPEIPELTLAAYPNPFNSSTTITFGVPRQTEGVLAIYNTTGQLVEILAQGSFRAGWHSRVWTADAAPAGLYFCAIRTEAGVKCRRVLVLK